MRSKRRRTPATLFLLVVALAASLELIMRAAGIVLLAPSDRRNTVQPEDARKFRILALGESTTADYFSGREEDAWPRRLERELRRTGVDARVYNEGLTGTTSAMIVSRLPEYIEKYRPAIVISMMGVNDRGRISYDASSSSRLSLMVSQIRIVKLAQWLADGADARLRCKIEALPLSPATPWELVAHGLDLAGKMPLDQVEKELRKQVLDERDLAIVLSKISDRLRRGSAIFNDLESDDFRNMRRYVDRAFDLYPYHHDIAFSELSGPVPRARCLEVRRKLLECGRNVPDDLLSKLIECGPFDIGLTSEPVFRSRGLFASSLQQSLLTSYHYRALNETLRRANIRHMAMQYPTKPVEELRSYFKSEDGSIESPFQSIIFISNQENFSRALKSHRYEDLFKDRFQGSWGHTTARGHQLIAEAALKAVLNSASADRRRAW